MAKNNNGYMGAFHGKLGPVVGYTWKGRSCMRAWQEYPHNPRTKKQRKVRTIFGTTSKLASAFLAASRIGLRGVAAERRISETSLFISLNRHCVSLVDNNLVVDYPSLTMADGDLPPVQFGQIQWEGNLQVGVDFGPVPGMCGCPDDSVVLVAYSPTEERSLQTLHAARIGNHISLELDNEMAAGELHFFGFTWDCGIHASPSEYLGNINIE